MRRFLVSVTDNELFVEVHPDRPCGSASILTTDKRNQIAFTGSFDETCPLSWWFVHLDIGSRVFAVSHISVGSIGTIDLGDRISSAKGALSDVNCRDD